LPDGRRRSKDDSVRVRRDGSVRGRWFRWSDWFPYTFWLIFFLVREGEMISLSISLIDIFLYVRGEMIWLVWLVSVHVLADWYFLAWNVRLLDFPCFGWVDGRPKWRPKWQKTEEVPPFYIVEI
jgi:hypothetical protein